MRLFPLPLLLFAIPVLEIAVFILVGSEIGVLLTLGLIFATTILGSILLRVQGFGAIQRIRRTMDEGRVPGKELIHGAMIFVAGVLLILPGFITDILGLLFFIPAVREFGWTFLKDRIVVLTPAYRPDSPSGPPPDHTPQQGRTIDLNTGEYSESKGSDTPWRQIERD